MSEEKKVEVKEARELFVGHLNTFYKTLVENLLDLKRHLVIQAEDPKYQRKLQNGQYQGIDELVEAYRENAENAKKYIDIINEMMKQEADGGLDATFAGLLFVETAEEAKEEEKQDGGPQEPEAPVETPVETPTEVPAETPAEVPEAPAEVPAEAPEAKS